MTDTLTAPQTVEEVLADLDNAKHDKKVFCIFASGRETEIIAVGKTYESAWKHAAEILDCNKDDLRKKGYVFDHLSVQNAQRIVNGLLPKHEPVKAPPKAQVLPIGRGKMTSAHLQKIARQAARESEQVEIEEDES
jgi:predicted Zn-ribbon and HTH transcriptional regulator